MSLLLFFASSDSIVWKHRRIPLIAGNVYKFSVKIRATVAQTFNIVFTNRSYTTNGLNARPTIAANVWKTFAYEFTALETDNDSFLLIKPSAIAHQFYVDGAKLINLTKERKQYRIMRIQGSVLPGTFVQTLTLREKTATETA